MKKPHYMTLQRPHNFKDYSGQRFGRLMAVEYLPGATNKGRWKCVCDCGGVAYTTPANLRRGQTASCGCSRKRPDSIFQQNKAVYLVFKEMRARCERPSHVQYYLYGGRGIKVCERWSSFENFLADMGPRPDGMSIDRKDSNGNYEPGNCRWATALEQARNTRRNRYLEFNGERKSLPEWADEYGMARATLAGRLKKAWSLSDALLTPVRPWPTPKGMKPCTRLEILPVTK